MSKQNHRTGLGAETNVDGRPFEDQFAKAERQGRELVEFSDRAIESNRQAQDRKAAYAAFRPRYEALREMAHSTIAYSRTESAATRRAALHKHPVFKALPDAAQRVWDSLVDDWTETIRSGDMGSVWRAVGDLADHQASSDTFADWDPPAPEFDTAADLASIPRG